ncbi:MAG: hypothetical protein HQM07_09490 [Zetaproteobacteria bacterium]|nr:hypothetical protein [Zetaproteobacteria bacterium]
MLNLIQHPEAKLHCISGLRVKPAMTEVVALRVKPADGNMLACTLN